MSGGSQFKDKLAGRPVQGGTAPQSGQTYTWNATTKQWGVGAPPDYYPYDPSLLASGTTQAAVGRTGDVSGGTLTDGATVSSGWSGYFRATPTHVYIIVIPAGTGNMAWFTNSDYGAIGEASTANSGAQGSAGTPQTTAMTSGQFSQIDVVGSFGSAAAGDFFGLDFERVGAAAGDTVNAAVIIVGLLVQYT